jgi:apolipoprotein N-acyltransferase
MRELFKVLIPPLAELVMSDDDIAAGEGTQVLALEDVNIGSLICFDSIYDGLARESVRDGAQLIALSTNDSWFTDSAALYMHNAQAKLRAVECDRYVVRAANTGISSIITNRGESVEELPPLEGGYIVQDVEIRTGRTLYSYIGNSFIYLCIAFLAIILIVNLCNLFKKNEQK